MAKVYDNATDLITFARSSYGTALRRVGYGDDLAITFSKTGDNGTNTVTLYDDGYDINQVDASSLARAYINGTFEANKTYVLAGDYTVSSGSFKIDQSNLAGGAITVSGHTVFRPLTAVTSIGIYRNAIPSAATFRNISVKEVIFDRPTDDLVLFNHPDDIPRIEYAADGSLKGLLIEEQRTNLVTYSGDFENAAWGAIRCDLTNDQAISPDGTQNAALMEATADDARLEMANLGDETKDHACSVWVKSATGSSVAGQLDNAGLDIVSFTATSEWQRVTAVFTTTGFGMRFRVRITNSGDSLYVYGAQLEEGPFPTSYIPTSGSQKTRDPDIASIPVSAFGYNQSAGTVVVEASKFGSNNYPRTAMFDNGFENNSIGLGAWGVPTSLVGYIVDGSSVQASIGLGANGNPGTSVFKHGLAFAANSANASVDGSIGSEDTSVTLPEVTTLRLGRNANAPQHLNGHIKSLQYYPRRLTDAQLQELTS